LSNLFESRFERNHNPKVEIKNAVEEADDVKKIAKQLAKKKKVIIVMFS